MALRNVFLACFAFVMCICVCVCAITTLVVINEESNPKQSPIPTPTPTLTPTPTTIYDDYAKIQRAVDNASDGDTIIRDGILYFSNNNNSFRININEFDVICLENRSNNDKIIFVYDNSNTYHLHYEEKKLNKRN